MFRLAPPGLRKTSEDLELLTWFRKSVISTFLQNHEPRETRLADLPAIRLNRVRDCRCNARVERDRLDFRRAIAQGRTNRRDRARSLPSRAILDGAARILRANWNTPVQTKQRR